jgi:hypothetical protein
MEARGANIWKFDMRWLTGACFIALVLVASPLVSNGQDEVLQYEIAPPPLKFVAKEEQSKLDAEPDMKDRTKLAIGMMNARMEEAEKLNTAEQFDSMFTELGHFGGLLDYTLKYLGSQDADSKKTLNNYKRLEISIRGFLNRLEIIRRDLPIKYEKYVRDLSRYLRSARTKALDPQFGDTVLPESTPQ